MKAAVRGFVSYFEVIPLFTKLKLWRYVWLTAAISVALAVALIIGGVLTGKVTSSLSSKYFESSSVLAGLAFALATVSVIAVGLLAFKHLVLVATSPWMGKVASRVDDHLLAKYSDYATESPVTTESATTARSIRLNLRLFTRELLLTIPLLLATLIPILNVGAVFLLFVVQAYFVGAGSLDYTLERRYRYRESIAYFNDNRLLASGLGAGFMLLLATGLGVLLAPAWSAAAGAMAFAKTTRRAAATVK